MASIGLLGFLATLSIASILGLAGFGVSMSLKSAVETLQNAQHVTDMQLMLLQLQAGGLLSGNETLLATGTCTNNGGSSAPINYIAIDHGSYVAVVAEIGPFNVRQTASAVSIVCDGFPSGIDNLNPILGIGVLFTMNQLHNISSTSSGLPKNQPSTPYPNYNSYISGTVSLSWTFQSPYVDGVDSWNFDSPTRFGLLVVNAM